MSDKQNDHYEETKKEGSEERPYCTCGKDANMELNDTEYQCKTCCKPSYVNWRFKHRKGTKYNLNNDFQKIPKEEFGISDWSAGYQEGLIAGRRDIGFEIEQWAIRGTEIIEKALDRGDIAQYNFKIEGDYMNYYDTVGYRKALNNLIMYMKEIL
jgi:hypothetical protein